MRALQIAIVGIFLGAGVPGLLALLGPWAWWLDLLAHFRLQYTAALLLALLLATAARRWRLALLGALLLAPNLIPIARLTLSTTPAAIDPPLQLAHLNLLTSNHQHDAVSRWIADSGAALVSLQEVDERWAAVLAAVPGYHMVHALPRADNFGLAILVRDDRAALVGGVEALELAGMPALALQLHHADRPVALLSLHTLPPVSRKYSETRDAQLAAAAAWAQAQRDAGAAPVILGDFNATPFSAALAPLIAADLQDSLTAGGLWTAGSWPDLPWPLRIAIDHCWHDARLVAGDRRIGPAVGSDHRPLRLDLRWAR
jgi:endonuclease/exonuclease/phosphatase (EEP) superfamily protein YafD